MVTENRTIPVMKPRIPSAKQVIPYLRRMDESGTYSNFGPLIGEFESRVSTLLGVQPEQVVTVSSATAGLRAAVSVITENCQIREWLVPNFSFAATGFSTPSQSLTRFLDVRRDDATIDLHSCLDYNSLGDSKVGVVQVLPFGNWRLHSEMQQSHPLVIDAAASLGNFPELSYLDENCSVVFSLHATKVLGIGEGGLIVSGSADLASEIRSWTTFGFRGQRIAEQPGFNAKMSEVAGAYALAAIDHWEEEYAEWMEHSLVMSAVSDQLGIQTPFSMNAPTPYWNVKFRSSDELLYVSNRLAEFQVETRKWYGTLLGDMPAFESSLCSHRTVASQWAGTILGLPRFRGMSRAVIDRVANALYTSVSEWRKHVR